MEGQQMNRSQRKGDLHSRLLVSSRNRRVGVTTLTSHDLWRKGI